VLWLLGYPDAAQSYLHKVLGGDDLTKGPFDRVIAYEHYAKFHHWRRDLRAMWAYGQKMVALAEKYEFADYRWLGHLHATAASAALGETDGSSALLHESIAALKAHGTIMTLPYYLSLVAEVCGQDGRTVEGLAALDEALTLATKMGEHFWTAEIHRLRGELLAAEGKLQAAEMAYQQALALARQQQAKSLELRAAISLARLWQTQGKRQDAYDLLAPLYEWFTEGFDTPDLKEAQALLASLGD
jgi:predicted ATPase